MYDPVRKRCQEINLALRRRAAAMRADFIDIGPKLTNKDGTISKDIMPDLLHPSAEGYEIWAKAIEPVVDRLLQPRN